MSFFRRLLGQREPASEPKPPRELDAPQRLALIRAYHDATRHDFHRFATGPFDLDWASQPDPFQRWLGAPLVALDHVPLEESPRFEDACWEGRVPSAQAGLRSLARFLEDSLALAAWKESGESRWALRITPSSGNLHPTEAHLLLGPSFAPGGEPVVAHYAPREHALELRASIPIERWNAVARGLPPESFLVVLTSIAWREAWKYGERAWRYCQLDLGHAIAALGVAASGLGWRARLIERAGTDELTSLVGLDPLPDPELEFACCLLAIGPEIRDPLEWNATPEECRALRALSWRGRPSALSPEHVDWSAIDAAREACVKPWGDELPRIPAPSISEEASSPEASGPALRTLLRGRRSAVAFDGRTAMERAAFLRLLARTRAVASAACCAGLQWSPRVDLVVLVHRVLGMEAGLYHVSRSAAPIDERRAEFSPRFDWEPIATEHEGLVLHRLASADMRSRGRSIACHQDIASDGCFSGILLADFEPALVSGGAWAWMRLHWEAGAVTHAITLQAEADGVRATGIGCFFDEPTHQLLGLTSRRRRCLYQLAVGRAVDDPRLTSRPPYPSGNPAQ